MFLPESNALLETHTHAKERKTGHMPSGRNSDRTLLTTALLLALEEARTLRVIYSRED